ncbi:fibronectin type III domain-containing protein [Candidatus Woesebacteria bacterium]|nr:fibronectin type III domain-containing protein [Candidatus Woesebacteria bacterium]
MLRPIRALISHFTVLTSYRKWHLQIAGATLVLVGVVVGMYFTLSDYLSEIHASDSTQSWTFATESDYTLSDSTAIEVTGTSARLKLQEYSGATANTSAVFHLDNDVVDASPNANSGSATSLSYTTGKFDNAAVFTGQGSVIQVPDSTSLSVTASHTLEAWVNMDTTFNATSHSERQTIYDKGSYQLYLEHTSGKIFYELETAEAKSWTQRAGPNLDANNGNSINSTWDLNGKPNIYDTIKVGSYLYAAIGSATGANDGELWRCSGCDGSTPTWTKIGGDGVFSSWPIDTYEYIASLGTDGTVLYIGMGGSTAGDGDLWRCSGCDGSSPTWTKVGGDAVSSSWPVNTYESVTSMVVSGTTVYVGLGNSTAGDAEVWRCTSCNTSPAWGGNRIGGDATNSSWANSTYEDVRSLTLIGSHLVAGLGNTQGDGEVWSTDTGTISWVKRGGDGTATGGQSWGSLNEQVNGLGGDSNILYVGLGTTPANEAEIWRCDLSATCTATAGWTQIGGDGLNTSWNTNYESVRRLLVSGTTMYVGLGDSGGDAEVWQCTNCTATPTWTKLGGDGTYLAGQSWGANHTQVNSFTLDGTTLYVGISSTAFSSELWRCDTGATCTNTAGWTPLGGGYINNSWELMGIQTVQELASGNEKVYAGTGNTQVGNALVWEYDPSDDSWTIIGGQGANGGWNIATYESVDSLLYYKGMLYAGLGRSTGDGDVWRWNGTSWSQVGGDALNTSWPASTYESVPSMVVYMGKLYAGLGNNANGDAEVWRCTNCDTTPSWTKVGGDGLYSGWAAGTFREVASMVQTNGMLFVGLAGPTTGDAEVWRCSSACDGGTPAWTRVGGDGINSGWINTAYERVDSMSLYNGQIIVGLGNTAGDAEVWACTGCEGGSASWGGTRLGGDDPSGSSGSTYGWADSTFEQVLDLVEYNGFLYAGLGITAGESELWRYDTGSWTKVGGDGLNNSWDSTINYVNALAVHKGKLYAGTGGDANNDATIWSYGNDSVATSDVLSLTSGTWYHIAATYDAADSEMKLYLNGVQSGTTKAATLTVADNAKALLIGRGYGSRGNVSASASFTGKMDELRISDVERSSFQTTPYSTQTQTILPTSAVYTSGVKNFDAFAVSETLNGGTVTYRLSSDGGSTWKYYIGGAWTTSASTAQSNTATEINSEIASFPIGTGGILWQAILTGDGSEQVTLSSVDVGAIHDVTAPTNPDTLTALSAVAGDAIVTETWYQHAGPYFSWSGATDTGGSGVSGYYVYFGTDQTAEPVTAGVFQVGTTYTASNLSSGSTYYLRIKAKDNAQNTTGTTWSAFTYQLDSTAPTNPASVSVNPAGYAATNDYTFSWPAGTDGGSGIAGYQYKTATASGALADWSTTTTSRTVSIPDAAYQTGENVFYLRTLDTAGNTAASSTQVSYYFGGDGPSEPQFLAASPTSNTTNAFAFSWQAPDTFSGLANELTYCYTVNTLPNEDNCTYTSAGATSLSASSFATQVGLNTFYLVARNGENYGSTINYASYASVTFTADTSAPGIPLNADIADVSVKSTESWKLAVSWEPPTDEGSGVESYEIHRSLDDTTFTKVAETTGIAFVDTGLDQAEYFYKVRACDSVNNCGSYSTAVSLTPTGKFTSAATLSTGPTISNITTKQAKISWGTDRASDSKIQYGTSAGSYFTSEPSTSTQTTDHSITLTNLSPGTTYFYKARWTDEDGNTGASAEKSFTTEAAPSVKDVAVKNVGLTSGLIQFTSSGASKVKIYYGETTAFGGVKEITTGTSESSYTAQIEELEDGVKYYYKLNAFDSENAEYEGTILDFSTLPRPKISTVRIQQVRNTAQPTVLVSWETNTPTSSIITYYPTSNPAQAKDEVNVELKEGEHQLLIRGLAPETPYTLVVKGRDLAGNEAASDPQRLTTATDTRPAQITGLTVEGSVQASQNTEESVAQLVVSWTTDEPATSQIEYGEGTGSTYSQRSQEDSNMTINHLVVITGLSPSKVYHLRAISKDKANNESKSIDTVTITAKATDNALDLVITNLRQVFGFLGALQ